MGTCIFITGGVRSGKSAFAEQRVQQLTQDAAYVATSEAFDTEMQQRIQRHQQDREQQQMCWTLYETPYTLTIDIEQPVVLFECVTTWLTNTMFLQQINEPVAQFQQWLTTLLAAGKTVVIVSNELLDSGLTPYKETNEYLQTIGQLHTWLVQQSDEAYELTNTLVVRWK